MGALYTPGSFFLFKSSVSKVGGQDLMSTTLLASLDFNSLITPRLERTCNSKEKNVYFHGKNAIFLVFSVKSITMADLETSTIILTVGNVVCKF